jgi:hypothetical protein
MLVEVVLGAGRGRMIDALLISGSAAVATE